MTAKGAGRNREDTALTNEIILISQQSSGLNAERYQRESRCWRSATEENEQDRTAKKKRARGFEFGRIGKSDYDSISQIQFPSDFVTNSQLNDSICHNYPIQVYCFYYQSEMLQWYPSVWHKINNLWLVEMQTNHLFLDLCSREREREIGKLNSAEEFDIN